MSYDFSHLSLDQITFLLGYLDRDKDLFNPSGRQVDLNAIIALKKERLKKTLQSACIPALRDASIIDKSCLKLLQTIIPVTDEEFEKRLLQQLSMPQPQSEMKSL